MGRKRYVVPSLQSLAFMVSYKDIFKKLRRCQHYEEEEETDGEISMLEDQPYYASLDGTISYIRACLSQHTVGTMSDDIRYTFVLLKLFNFYYTYLLFYRKMFVKTFYEALSEFSKNVGCKKFR